MPDVKLGQEVQYTDPQGNAHVATVVGLAPTTVDLVVGDVQVSGVPHQAVNGFWTEVVPQYTPIGGTPVEEVAEPIGESDEDHAQ